LTDASSQKSLLVGVVGKDSIGWIDKTCRVNQSKHSAKSIWWTKKIRNRISFKNTLDFERKESPLKCVEYFGLKIAGYK